LIPTYQFALLLFCCSDGILQPVSSFHAFSTAAAGAKTTTAAAATRKDASSSYDVIVIGGGSAGLTAAKLACKTLGASCALIEADRLGGDCTWSGCLPSKSLLAVAKARHAAATATAPLRSAPPPADWNAIRTTLQDNIQQVYDADDSPEVLAGMGISVFTGTASLLTDRTVQVTPKQSQKGQNNDSDDDDDTPFQLHAKEGIVLCIGASPGPPTIEGLVCERGSGSSTITTKNYLTYENIWELTELPRSLTVVGGGPIGCEMSQAFQRLGTEVTLVSRTLLPREDPAVGDVLEDVFGTGGIRRIKDRVVRVEDDGKMIVTASGDRVPCEKLLVATGRVPRIRADSSLGLASVGIALTADQSAIAVNANLETSVKGIYAAGDCTGDRQL
jgi:pyruvate/2-oxoglutarate dehydrogenase complex dihydrolipoamide dehydrogenase (E3) component